MNRSPENDATEILRCIYCQRTIAWPVTQAYPHRCLHCRRPWAYTAERVTSPAATDGSSS